MTAAQSGDPERWRDEEALRALSTAYAAAADERDGDGLAALFEADGVLVVPDYPRDLRPTRSRTGHEALREVGGALGRYHRTFHLVSNHRFAIDGDQADGEVLCVAHHLTVGDDPATDTVWFIRYRDQYRRTGDGWRFTRRELHLQWVEERPVLVHDPSPWSEWGSPTE